MQMYSNMSLPFLVMVTQLLSTRLVICVSASLKASRAPSIITPDTLLELRSRVFSRPRCLMHSKRSGKLSSDKWQLPSLSVWRFVSGCPRRQYETRPRRFPRWESVNVEEASSDSSDIGQQFNKISKPTGPRMFPETFNSFSLVIALVNSVLPAWKIVWENPQWVRERLVRLEQDPSNGLRCLSTWLPKKLWLTLSADRLGGRGLRLSSMLATKPLLDKSRILKELRVDNTDFKSSMFAPSLQPDRRSSRREDQHFSDLERGYETAGFKGSVIVKILVSSANSMAFEMFLKKGLGGWELEQCSLYFSCGGLVIQETTEPTRVSGPSTASFSRSSTSRWAPSSKQTTLKKKRKKEEKIQKGKRENKKMKWEKKEKMGGKKSSCLKLHLFFFHPFTTRHLFQRTYLFSIC